MSAALRAVSLVKRFRRRTVVDGVTIEVHPGEVVGLLGQNGAGKTTTFYMLVGLLRPDGGQVWLGDRNVSRASMVTRARAGIGYLPQEPSVFRKLTVAENLQLVLEMRGVGRGERAARIEELLREFNLGHLRDERAAVLSGGERRRVEIARALALRPRFILLDEPFTGVDPIEVHAIQEMVNDLRQRNIGVLITDHNVRETLATTDRSYIIREGRLIASGTSEEIAQDPLARRHYLGEHFRLW